MIESAYRGDSARQGWSNEADLLAGDRTSETEVAEIIDDPCQRTVLAEIDGVLTGSVTITDKGDGRIYLGMLAVDPRAQAGGLGRALIAAAEAEAGRTFAGSVMEMTVIGKRTELIEWYQRRGYRLTGERRPFPADVPEAPGLEMVVLERAIV